METKKPSFYERANHWLANSITMRLVTMGVLILLLLIPVSMVRELIQEREYRQQNVISEVSGKWGRSQTVKGPVLTVPYYTYTRVYDHKKEAYVRERATNYAYFLPDELHIEGTADPRIRYRGIYEVVVYNAQVNLNGTFTKPDFSGWKVEEKDILWDEATLTLGLSDFRSVQEHMQVNWGSEELPFNPGSAATTAIKNGVSTRVPLRNDSTVMERVAFSVELDFNGSSNLFFVPVGKSTTVSLNSSWKDPKFDGAFLPDSSNIRADGFSADWQVLHLNRTYPQRFRSEVTGLPESAFGVSLLVPVDEYQKSMRSAKYAVLFITLTFLIFFFVQILNKVRIHPIQYLIVGLAICVFYTLLVALSEHLSFLISYLVASVAIIGMITTYASSILRNKKLTIVTAGILSVLYLFIFTIIQLQDYALLMGSTGLFLTLAVIMYLSRNIEWYALGKRE